LLGLDLLGELGQLLADAGDGGLDAALQADRVGAGGHVAQALAHQGLGQHGGGGGAVTGDVVGLLGDLLDELGADLLVRLLELDLLGDGDTVVGDGGGAPLLLQHDVAALGAERHLDGVSERVHAALEAATGFLVERDQFGCHRVPVLPGRADTRRSDPMPATDDRGPDGVPVPAAAASSSRSWISTPATGVLTTPLFSTRPLRVQTPRRG